MENVPNSLLIGLLFIAAGVLGFAPFFRLSQIFEYPDILRQPTGDILKKYRDGGNGLTVTWFVFALFSVPLFALAPLLQTALAAKGVDTTYLTIATVIGVAAAVLNIVGLMRWVFLVPLLVKKYFDPATTQAARDAVEVVFEAFHTYLGVTLGEFLGFTFIGLWGILEGLAFIQTGIVSPLFGVAMVIFSAGIIVGDLEFAGWKPAGMIVAISSSLIMILLVIVGVVFIIG
jgi:hypothetical protein